MGFEGAERNMTDPAPSCANGPAGLLLRRISELRQQSGIDRLKNFESLCWVGVGQVGPQFPPEDCVATLLQVAREGGLQFAVAAYAIERSFRESCLLLPRAATRQLEADPAGANDSDWGNRGGRQLSHDGSAGQRADHHQRRRPQRKPKRARLRRSDTKTAACAQWLEQVLADGRARRSLELQRRARQHGLLRLGEAITRNSPLNDARKQLGVIVRRRGFGPGARYEWLLPRPSEHAPGSRFMRWTVSPRR